MDLTKKYYDSKVNERNILEMVKLEPKWAAERIHELEDELEKKEDFANVIGAIDSFKKEDNGSAWVIEGSRERFKELSDSGIDWKSFYMGWTEGRAKAIKENQ